MKYLMIYFSMVIRVTNIALQLIITMSSQQNLILLKLRQAINERDSAFKFSELMNTNIRINKDDINYQETNAVPNSLLPSISNQKISFAQRIKSHSERRLSTNVSHKKNESSRKKLIKQDCIRKQESAENLLKKKQSVSDFTKGNAGLMVSNKIISFKTPNKQETTERDTNIRSNLILNSDKSKHVVIKQFWDKIEGFNEDIILPIKMGQIDEENANFKKFQNNLTKLKASNEISFLAINNLLQKIAGFIKKYKISQGLVQAKHFMPLSKKKIHSNFELINCFANKQEIIKRSKISGLQYYTRPEIKGKNLAALKITSLFKMNSAKVFCRKLKSLMKKVKTIQKYWRMCLLIKRQRRNMMNSINKKIEKYNDLQANFSKNWTIIKTSVRVEVHICSYSLEQFKRITLKDLKQKQNCQISRIFRALETDVIVVYVVPIEVNEDLMKYYQSIFSFNASKIEDKVHFIIPENISRLTNYSHLTTTSLLLYSPKALRRIMQIIGSRYGYIVPSYPSTQYINLASQLNIPVLSFHQSLCKVYSTKSGCQNIFKPIAKKQKSPICVSKSVHSIFSEKELINSWAVMIYRNPNIKIWYLKIEDEINSRGLAYLNLHKISFLRQFCSNTSSLEEIESKEMIKLIAEQLHNKLRYRLKIVSKDIYPSYDQFINHFLTRGGVLEACPSTDDKIIPYSISFFIDPIGEFYIAGTYNKLQLGSKSICQAIKFPSVIDIDYQAITRSLYKQLWVKMKLFGYFTADFLYLETTKQSFAIGLDCFLNQKTSSLFFINYCSNARYVKDRNLLLNSKQEGLHYIYCPSISLYQLPSIPHFFKGCKFQNISFDLQQKVGTIFMLLDSLETGQLGFICIQRDFEQLLIEMKKLVEYLSRTYRKGKNSNDQVGLLKGVVTTWIRKYFKNNAHESSVLTPITLQ